MIKTSSLALCLALALMSTAGAEDPTHKKEKPANLVALSNARKASRSKVTTGASVKTTGTSTNNPSNNLTPKIMNVKTGQIVTGTTGTSGTTGRSRSTTKTSTGTTGGTTGKTGVSKVIRNQQDTTTGTAGTTGSTGTTATTGTTGTSKFHTRTATGTTTGATGTTGTSGTTKSKGRIGTAWSGTTGTSTESTGTTGSTGTTAATGTTATAATGISGTTGGVKGITATRNVTAGKFQANAGNWNQIHAQHLNFHATVRPQVVSVTFNQNYRIAGAQNWKGPQYVVFQQYQPQWHDQGWWQSHYSNNVVLVGGGWYYWDSGYFRPAWGYDPGNSYYPYDGPIYVGRNPTPPDQIIADVQTALQQQGLYHGEIDGLLGPQTREALAHYQEAQGLEETAAIDEPTLNSLGFS
jgi:hypothetical protein